MLEISVVVALAIAYNLIRAIPHGNDIIPFEHARDILALEGALFDMIEKPLNVWINTVPVVAVIACYYYALLHYAATPIVFFMSRRRGGWQYWRGYWALIIASGTALVVYALYPLAPPRLTPGIGIVDIMREYAAYGWWGSAASAPRGIGDATNQFAAMPSMHFGWALWCGIQMWGFKTKVWRILAVAYPSILVFVVLATGNHYFLDVIGGGLCVLFGYGVVELIGRRHPGPQTSRARACRRARSASAVVSSPTLSRATSALPTAPASEPGGAARRTQLTAASARPRRSCESPNRRGSSSRSARRHPDRSTPVARPGRGPRGCVRAGSSPPARDRRGDRSRGR